MVFLLLIKVAGQQTLSKLKSSNHLKFKLQSLVGNFAVFQTVIQFNVEHVSPNS